MAEIGPRLGNNRFLEVHVPQHSPKVMAGGDACEMRVTRVLIGDFDLPSASGVSANS